MKLISNLVLGLNRAALAEGLVFAEALGGAAGSGIAYNAGRFATAVGFFAAGVLFSTLGGSYPRVGSLCGLIYALGLIVIWWAPDTSLHKLHE